MAMYAWGGEHEAGSHHCWEPERAVAMPDVPPPALQRLGPLHIGASAGAEPPVAQLRSVVEAVLRMLYAAPNEGEGGEGAGEAADPRTVAGMRKALSQEPSLAWAEQHAPMCVKLLKERCHSAGSLLPLGKESRQSAARQRLAQRVGGKPGRLPPVGAGGAGCVAAFYMKSQSTSSLSGAAAAKLAGIESEITAPLSWRLRELAASRPRVVAWLVVEVCRDCSKHPVYAHNESSFTEKYSQLKAAVERNFPEELQVELLFPRADDRREGAGGYPAPESEKAAQPQRSPATPQPAGTVPPIRPGSFEVYLCCPEPLAPFGAVSLPAWTSDQDDPDRPPPSFTAICVSSRLQTKTWPAPEAILRRLVPALPRIPLRVLIRTHDGLPVPGVEVKAATALLLKRKDWSKQTEAEAEGAGGIKVAGRTNAEGLCRFSVPVCVPLKLEAEHEVLLGYQERDVMFASFSAQEVFLAENTMQLWQVEDGKELVVFCSSPRSNLRPSLPGACEPFTGFLQGKSKKEYRVDDQGCVRGTPKLLADIRTVSCLGWRSAPISPEALDIHGKGSALEMARLGYPLVKVALVSACCGTHIPGARVCADGEVFGVTGADGEPVSCGLRMGDHMIEASHTLCAEPMKIPFSVRNSTNCGVQVKLSAKRLRFVCLRGRARVSSAGSITSNGQPEVFADLWLVGGSVDDCSFGRDDRPCKDDVFFWDGELLGARDDGAEASFSVRNGVMTSAVTGSTSGGEESMCALTKALNSLRSSDAGWHVAMNVAWAAGTCAMGKLARGAQDDSAATWIGRLAVGSEASVRDSEPQPLRVKLRSSCCGCRCCSPSINVDGEIVDLDKNGCVELPAQPAGTQTRISLGNIPSCLLPGGASDFVLRCGSTGSSWVSFEVLCSLWVYWLPEEDDGEADLVDCLVFVAINPDDIPEEAQPVKGVLRCPGASREEVTFCGNNIGPFPLRVAPSAGQSADEAESEHCLLARLTLDLEPPQKFSWRAKEPSPLAERVAEVGGCELERLARCPVGLGTFRPQPPPGPHKLELRCSCCGRSFPDAEVTLNGKPVPSNEESRGAFDIPRRRIAEDWTGRHTFEVAQVPVELLPQRTREIVIPFGPDEPDVAKVELSCMVWLYWVPPDEDTEQEPPEGTIYVCANVEHIPSGARAVSGRVQCAGAKQPEVELEGGSWGPVQFVRADSGDTSVDEGADGEVPCLLSTLAFDLDAPADFEYLPGKPAWTSEGDDDDEVSSDCALYRLTKKPMAIGKFRALNPPSVELRLRSACCNRSFENAQVAINGDDPVGFDHAGCLLVPRQRRGGTFCMSFMGVPRCLMPGGTLEKTVTYGRKSPESVDIEVQCLVWVYWTPPEPEEACEDGEPFDEEPPLPEGLLWLTTNEEQVPHEALAVMGVMECEKALNPRLTLDGSGLGPFKIRPSDPGNNEDDDELCLLADLKFQMVAPRGFQYFPKTTSPMLERCQELGGCELHRVSNCPVAVGAFRELPHPFPRRLCFKSACCGGGWSSASVTVDGVKAPVTSSAGVFRVPNRPCQERYGEQTLSVVVDGVPEHVLPGCSNTMSVMSGPHELENYEVDVECSLFVYWVPPDDDEEESLELADEEEPVQAMGMVFLATSVQQVPGNAAPVRGFVRCPGCYFEEGEQKQTVKKILRTPGSGPKHLELDGGKIGPFFMRRLDKDSEEAANEEEGCLLARVSFDLQAPAGFEYAEKDPSPLAERVQELGGCELERLVHCPLVVGIFKSLPRPPLQICMRTSCCGRAYPGASVAMGSQQPRPCDENGCVEIHRRNGGSCCVNVQGVPPQLLPRGLAIQSLSYGAFEPASVDIEISCNVWVYWIPPEEEEEGFGGSEADEDGEEPEPAEALVCLAVDPAHIPDEAKAVYGSLEGANILGDRVELDGQTLGPYRVARMTCPQSGEEHCVLGNIEFLLDPPKDYIYRPKDPSPLSERLKELGGCELERLTACSVVIGFFSPAPRPPLRLLLKTNCCGRGITGAALAAGSGEPEPFDHEGVVEVRRKREGGALRVHVHSVPACLLGGCGATRAICHGPFEPKQERLEVFVPFCIYWVPPAGEGDEEDPTYVEQGDAEGIVYVAVNEEQIPKGAVAVEGLVECPGAVTSFLALDGSSIGPFNLQLSTGGISPRTRRNSTHGIPEGFDLQKTLWRAGSNCSSVGGRMRTARVGVRRPTVVRVEDDEPGECMLSRLTFMLRPPEDHELETIEPHPLKALEDDEGLGAGCPLRRLAEAPVAVAKYSSAAPPPLDILVRTPCCRRGFEGACAKFGEREMPFDERGRCRTRRKRIGGAAKFTISGVPPFILSGGVEQTVTYGPRQPLEAEVKVECPMWIYWVPPDEDEEAGEEPIDATVWLALDQEQVPPEAKPLEGFVECPGTLMGRFNLNGTSLGPFSLPPMEEDTPSPSRRPSHATTDESQVSGLQEPPEIPGAVDGGAETEMPCRLAGLQFRISPPAGYAYRAKDPTPLAERVEELGGCESQRLLTGCPVVVGFLTPTGRGS